MEYCIYCDESCHLEHDGFPVMCVGAIKVPSDRINEYKVSLKEIKKKFGILHEIKWNTISSTHVPMYKELIDCFFGSDMEFRCVLITYKDRLDKHSFINGDHDNFYYKLIHQLLYNPYAYDYDGKNTQYRVFLDIKDANGRSKLDKITRVFNDEFRGCSPFIQFQHIRSHESQFIQLTDIFIGAITYRARNLDQLPEASAAKKTIIEYLELKSGYTLNEGTMPSERKFNILNHQPRKK